MSSIAYMQAQTKGLNPVEALTLLADQYPGEIVFSTSFGWEDQVITHINNSASQMIDVFIRRESQA